MEEQKCVELWEMMWDLQAGQPHFLVSRHTMKAIVETIFDILRRDEEPNAVFDCDGLKLNYCYLRFSLVASNIICYKWTLEHVLALTDLLPLFCIANVRYFDDRGSHYYLLKRLLTNCTPQDFASVGHRTVMRAGVKCKERLPKNSYKLILEFALEDTLALVEAGALSRDEWLANCLRTKAEVCSHLIPLSHTQTHVVPLISPHSLTRALKKSSAQLPKLLHCMNARTKEISALEKKSTEIKKRRPTHCLFLSFFTTHMTQIHFHTWGCVIVTPTLTFLSHLFFSPLSHTLSLSLTTVLSDVSWGVFYGRTLRL
jgi:hypothetical protein